MDIKAPTNSARATGATDRAAAINQAGDPDAIAAAFRSAQWQEQSVVTPEPPQGTVARSEHYSAYRNMRLGVPLLPRPGSPTTQENQAKHMAQLARQIPGPVDYRAGPGERFAVHEITKAAQRSKHATSASLRYVFQRDREAYQGRAHHEQNGASFNPSERAVEHAILNTLGTSNAALMASVIRDDPKTTHDYSGYDSANKDSELSQLNRDLANLEESDPIHALDPVAARMNVRPDDSHTATSLVPEYHEHEGPGEAVDPDPSPSYVSPPTYR